MGAEQSTPQRREYRSGKRRREEDSYEAFERALDLLSETDFANIAHASFPQIRGPVSWAKLGEFVCHEIKRSLAALHTEDDLRDAASHATVLFSRLQARDSVKGARTTRELRDTIMQIAAVMKALTEAHRIYSGSLTPNFESASRISTVRQLWARLGIKDNPWVKGLMEQVVAGVLASDATPGVKAAFNRLLLAWLPPPPSSGTRVQWDSDDDF